MIAGTVALSIENARFSEDLKKALRTNEALLRISLPAQALNLEDLLILSTTRSNGFDTEGAVVLLWMKKSRSFLPSALPMMPGHAGESERGSVLHGSSRAGKVIKTGEPIIVSILPEKLIFTKRGTKAGYKTRNLVQILASRIESRGFFAPSTKKEDFDKSDVELLTMISGTVALSIENAKVSEELQKAYKEVTGLNRAKDKAINHLSHELKTPVAIITSSLALLTKKMAAIPESTWKTTAERIKRNLDRILEIQYEVDDIMEDRQTKAYGLLTLLLEQCDDEIEALIAEQASEGAMVEKVRKRIDDLFGPKEVISKDIDLGQALRERLEALKPFYGSREVEIKTDIESGLIVFLPVEVLQKVIDGLIRNAIENTPDEGRIELEVHRRGEGTLLQVHDYGVGIPEEAQKEFLRILYDADTWLTQRRRLSISMREAKAQIS
jgi:signal transduction histidine kinase